MRAVETICRVSRVDLPDDKGRIVPSLRVECLSCGRVSESFGQRGRSMKRCLKALSKECLGDNSTICAIHVHGDNIGSLPVGG